MSTTQEQAQELLDQARNEAWWGGVWSNFGWAIDHIVQFVSGVLRTGTPSYELTLNCMLRSGAISRADYDVAMKESNESRAGQSVGLVVFVLVNGAATVARSGGSWLIVRIAGGEFYFGGPQALVFIDLLLKESNIWAKP
jgi:hypothetical protein